MLFQREQATPEVTILQAGGARRPKRRKVIEREQKIKTLADELANVTGTLTRTCQQLDTVLILANMFHCYIQWF